MATITVTNRIEKGNYKRNKIPDVSLEQNVSSFRNLIVESTQINTSDFDIIYCGQRLEDDVSLESCGLQSGSMVNLLPPIAVQHLTPPTEDPSAANMKALIKLLQSMMKNPAYRATVESIVNQPDKLHDIVNAVPGLHQHPTTISLFLEPDLLKVLIRPGSPRRVMYDKLLEKHPYFPQLAKVISDLVTETGHSGQFTTATARSYNLDNMSDDDDDNETGASGGQAITANQLAAALAAATGTTPVLPSTSSQSGGQAITANQLAAALAAATGTTPVLPSTSSQSQLRQMREMGITDENVARQALQATNGDLQAALDLLLEGGMP